MFVWSQFAVEHDRAPEFRAFDMHVRDVATFPPRANYQSEALDTNPGHQYLNLHGVGLSRKGASTQS